MIFKKHILILLSFFPVLILLACANPTTKSQELFETGQFEEQQRNFPHAKQLYEQILKEYPQTPAAAKAKERLKALESGSPAAP